MINWFSDANCYVYYICTYILCMYRIPTIDMWYTPSTPLVHHQYTLDPLYTTSTSQTPGTPPVHTGPPVHPRPPVHPGTPPVHPDTPPVHPGTPLVHHRYTLVHHQYTLVHHQYTPGTLKMPYFLEYICKPHHKPCMINHLLPANSHQHPYTNQNDIMKMLFQEWQNGNGLSDSHSPQLLHQDASAIVWSFSNL